MSRFNEWILIIDFGSNYTGKIAQSIRKLNVYCEILPYHNFKENSITPKPMGVVFSGDYKGNNIPPTFLIEYFNKLEIPILNINNFLLFIELSERTNTQKENSSHLKLQNDAIATDLNEQVVSTLNNYVNKDFNNRLITPILTTDTKKVVLYKHNEKSIYTTNFEINPNSWQLVKKLLYNFVFKICNCQALWTPKAFISWQIENIKKTVGSNKVLCALSGGVDSTVVATLLHKAIGNQLKCIFVDNGLLRHNEFEDVLKMYKDVLKLPVKGINASDLFLTKLKDVDNPEEKRKIIGNTFIDVFEGEIKDGSQFKYLAQGTLYTDIIESVSVDGKTPAVKSHHNVGGLPEKMKLKLLEPVKELYKYEVRQIGVELGIPEAFIARHPFPGPGLGIRVLGDITPTKLNILRKSDKIFIEQLKSNNLYHSVWQAATILLPVKSVGVKNNNRVYEYTVALRAVNSEDGVNADWVELPYPLLKNISTAIINKVDGVSRVVYDISSKPPATIEWE